MSKNSTVQPSGSTSDAITDKFNKLVGMLNDLKSSQNKLVTTVNLCRDSIKSQDLKLTSFDSKFDLLSNQIASVIEENKSLRSRIEQLESKLSNVERTQTPSLALNQEKLFSEFMDRQLRARNVIIFNIPDVSPSASDQPNDNALVDEIFNLIGVSIKPLAVHRLGKLSSKPHPIRIFLPSPSDVFQILKVKRQLFNVDKFKNIQISPDRTLQQRKLFSSVASELKLRKDAGETDLFIKFVNNCPTISKNGQATQRY